MVKKSKIKVMITSILEKLKKIIKEEIHGRLKIQCWKKSKKNLHLRSKQLLKKNSNKKVKLKQINMKAR